MKLSDLYIIQTVVVEEVDDDSGSSYYSHIPYFYIGEQKRNKFNKDAFKYKISDGNRYIRDCGYRHFKSGDQMVIAALPLAEFIMPMFALAGRSIKKDVRKSLLQDIQTMINTSEELVATLIDICQ